MWVRLDVGSWNHLQAGEQVTWQNKDHGEVERGAEGKDFIESFLVGIMGLEEKG